MDSLKEHIGMMMELAHYWRMMEGKLDHVLTQALNKQKWEEGRGVEEELFADEDDGLLSFLLKYLLFF